MRGEGFQEESEGKREGGKKKLLPQKLPPLCPILWDIEGS